MLCACLIVGFGISTVSTSMMIKSHNQIIQEFLYISWIKCHLNTSHNKATCIYPLRVTPTTSLGSDRHHFGTFVMKILFKICCSQLYQLNMIFDIITIYNFGITSTYPSENSGLPLAVYQIQTQIVIYHLQKITWLQLQQL